VAVIRGWDFPEELYYQVEKHVWVRRLSADAVQVGLTPVGYELLRHSLTAISVRTKHIGEVVPKGKSIAMVESLKYIGPLAAPLTGVLVRANEHLQADPDIAPADPYGEGWIAELQPLDWEADSASLVTGEVAMVAYEKWLASEKIAWE
jgi:glycine cleavage system H protein